jgi:uncharacterized membrane protein
MPARKDWPSVQTPISIVTAFVLLVILAYSFVIGHPILGLLGVGVAVFSAATLYLLYRVVLAVERLADAR